MRKTVLVASILLSVFILAVPFLTVFGVIFMMPSQHSHIFHGELNQKVARLDAIEGPKLVVIGGSSVAFGLDSALLERCMGMPVVNFGLYGELGTKLMLDLSEDAIGAGDIVVIAPELSEQTLSLYFSTSSTWRALDDAPWLISRLSRQDRSSMLGSAWGFAAKKLQYLLGREEMPNPKGIYNARNFNVLGDFYYVDESGQDLRSTNIMASYGEPDMPICSSFSAYASDFIAYLNAYIARVRGKGASVYYAWCPMNRCAVSNGSGGLVGLGGELPAERIAELEGRLAEALDCEILGSYADYAYPPEYFFDTNFHLNSAGAEHHTANLARDLSLAHLGESREPDRSLLKQIPELPRASDEELARLYVSGDFLLRVQPSGQAFTVVGLSETGKTKETLVLPMSFAGDGMMRPVTAIGEGAFAGATVAKTVVVGPVADFSSLGAGAYANSSIESVYVYAAAGTFGAGAIREGAEDLTVYFSAENYGDFVYDYAWEGVFQNDPDLQKPTEIPYSAWLNP